MPRWRSTGCCTCRSACSCWRTVLRRYTLPFSAGVGSVALSASRNMGSDENSYERGRRSAAVLGRGVSRRVALGLGAAGVAGVATAASLFDFFSRWRDAEGAAEGFKGDAPNGEVWELWRKRGWVKEAAHQLKLGRN